MAQIIICQLNITDEEKSRRMTQAHGEIQNIYLSYLQRMDAKLYEKK